MPEPSNIEFVQGLPRARPAGAYVDLADGAGEWRAADGSATITTTDLFSSWGEGASDWFADWMSELNRRNAGLAWWAHTSSAKNFLSSPLGGRVLEVLAICNLARSGKYPNVYVRGATPGQARALRGLLQDARRPPRLALWVRWRLDQVAGVVEAVFRVFGQAFRVWSAFLPHRSTAARVPLDYAVLTYVEGAVDPAFDSYFGDLAGLVTERKASERLTYVAYVYTPYRKLLAGLQSPSHDHYVPLFAYARESDILWALGNSIRGLFRSPEQPDTAMAGTAAMTELLTEALREDIATRGYLHNLLVHACAIRMGRAGSPATVIYPYENKALEKAFLLGVREGCPAAKLVGYQHTSVTPRHLTLRFAPTEAETTPLPDRIVTVGDVTRHYLERQGNYPPGIFATGCALRQRWDEPLPPRVMSPDQPRVLLPTSSSVNELTSAVGFMRKIKERLPGLELAVRTHPNFPLDRLPRDLLHWVHLNAQDLAGTRLRDNLAWADLIAYVSSTVALESLMAGRPVIYLKIDAFDPDPLLDKVSFRWEARDADEFLAALSSLAALEPLEFQARREEAIAYVRSYLKPKSPEAIGSFFP